MNKGLLFLFFALATAQNWFVQRHYAASGCAGTPFLEAAGDGGPSSCTSAAPCQLTFSSPTDYTVSECTGNGPSITISGGLQLRSYTAPGCASGTLSTVTVYRVNDCISLGSSVSLRYVCTPTGATRIEYNDATCTNVATNTTLVSGVEGQCQPISAGAYDYVCSRAASTVVAWALVIALFALY